MLHRVSPSPEPDGFRPRGSSALQDVYDLPETHAIEKDGVMYYAFYADQWKGTIGI